MVTLFDVCETVSLTNTSFITYMNDLYTYYLENLFLSGEFVALHHKKCVYDFKCQRRCFPLFAQKMYLSTRFIEVCKHIVYVYKMWLPLSKNPLTPFLWNFLQPWQIQWLRYVNDGYWSTDHVVHIVKRRYCECRGQHLYIYLDVCQNYVLNIFIFISCLCI